MLTIRPMPDGSIRIETDPGFAVSSSPGFAVSPHATMPYGTPPPGEYPAPPSNWVGAPQFDMTPKADSSRPLDDPLVAAAADALRDQQRTGDGGMPPSPSPASPRLCGTKGFRQAVASVADNMGTRSLFHNAVAAIVGCIHHEIVAHRADPEVIAADIVHAVWPA